MDWNGRAWCGVHECNPAKCWYEHNPKASLTTGSVSAKKLRKRIKALHKLMQKENGYAVRKHK